MHFRAFLLAVLALVGLSNAVLQSTIDLQRLEAVFRDGAKTKELSQLYFSLKGLSLMKAKLPDVCQTIKDIKYDSNNVEQIFYLTNAAQLSGCANFLKPDVMGAATRTLDKKEPTLVEIYHAVYTMKAIGKGSVWEREDALKNLIKLLKKEDTPLSYGYVFALCEHLGCEAWTTTQTDSLLLAADESNGRALHFEGGLPATSLVLTTIIRSHKALKKPVPLTEAQRYKFGEYLVSRRAVSSPRGAALLLEAALALADDELSPVSIVIKGKKYVTSASDSIEISVSDIVGRPNSAVKPEEVIAQSATRLADDVVVLSKQALTPKGDKTTYILNLSKIKSQYGQYKVALSAGSKTTNVNVAVLGEISVPSIEFGLGDVDGAMSPKVTTITYPNKLSEKADHLQKMTLKFSVRDAQGKSVGVAQAFVRIASSGTTEGAADDEAVFIAEHDTSFNYKIELVSISIHLLSCLWYLDVISTGTTEGAADDEAVFIAEHDTSFNYKIELVSISIHLLSCLWSLDVISTGTTEGAADDEAVFIAEHDTSFNYKIELNVAAIGKHLSSGAGTYSLTLLLGDSSIAAPIQWHLGEVSFTFAKDLSTAGPSKASTARPRGPLPEIAHQFRSAEPRPPRAVSDVFALLAGAPLLLLLILWAKLRINLSNFPFTPAALVFHLALGASLGLYGVLWLQLSMFETVRYMLPLGAVTFLSGHRLLRRLVSDKGAK